MPVLRMPRCCGGELGALDKQQRIGCFNGVDDALDLFNVGGKLDLDAQHSKAVSLPLGESTRRPNPDT